MREVFYSVSTGNLLFFSVLLFAVKRGNCSANRWLAAFFLISALLLLQTIFEYNGFYREHPALLEVFTPLSFAWGTTYYLYVRKLIEPDRRISRTDLLHGVPALLCLALYCSLYMSSDSNKLIYFNRIMNDQPTEYDAAVPLSLLHFIIYLSSSFWFVTEHQKKVSNYFSGELEGRNLSWLLKLNCALLLIWLLWANFHLHEIFPSFIPALPVLKDFTPLLLAVVLFSLGYFAVKQNAIFPTEVIVNEKKCRSLDATGSIRLSETIFAEKKALATKLIQIMGEEKHHRSPDLTLPELANHLHISTNVLSDIINNVVGENFYDFVNRYRVEECKALLVDPRYDHYTTLGIGYEAGFNSKSTFHKVFKDVTGRSPARYRKEMQKVSPAL